MWELVNFDGSVWLDHSSSRSLVAAVSQPPVFPSLRDRLVKLGLDSETASAGIKRSGKLRLSCFQKACLLMPNSLASAAWFQ